MLTSLLFSRQSRRLSMTYIVEHPLEQRSIRRKPIIIHKNHHLSSEGGCFSGLEAKKGIVSYFLRCLRFTSLCLPQREGISFIAVILSFIDIIGEPWQPPGITPRFVVFSSVL